jgi:hypothetical protein
MREADVLVSVTACTVPKGYDAHVGSGESDGEKAHNPAENVAENVAEDGAENEEGPE